MSSSLLACLDVGLDFQALVASIVRLVDSAGTRYVHLIHWAKLCVSHHAVTSMLTPGGAAVLCSAVAERRNRVCLQHEAFEGVCQQTSSILPALPAVRANSAFTILGTCDELHRRAVEGTAVSQSTYSDTLAWLDPHGWHVVGSFTHAIAFAG